MKKYGPSIRGLEDMGNDSWPKVKVVKGYCFVEGFDYNKLVPNGRW